MKARIPCGARAVALGFLALGVLVPADARAVLVDFNDPSSLGAVTDAARFTFADRYQEDGLVFRPRVTPPDPALGGEGASHFHLIYERPGVLEAVIAGDRSVNPANEPRSLYAHSGRHVIQLTYDPNADGVPDPFNLLSLDVVATRLNVGVRDRFGNIAVYNDLTQGFTWGLIDANNLLRATLEGVGSVYGIDNVVFEPSRPGPVATPRGETRFDEVEIPPTSLTPELHRVVHGRVAVPEPGSLALVGAGLLSLLVLLARSRSPGPAGDGRTRMAQGG